MEILVLCLEFNYKNNCKGDCHETKTSNSIGFLLISTK